MENKQYKNFLNREYKNLKYTLKRNASIAILGLAMSVELLAYNTAIFMDNKEQSKKEIVITEKIQDTISTLDKIQNIQNIALGIGGASGLYLILGCGIPLVNYKKKKKSLEKDLTETSSE